MPEYLSSMNRMSIGPEDENFTTVTLEEDSQSNAVLDKFRKKLASGEMHGATGK